MGDYIFILEMMVQTIDGMINEPIGAYSTEEEAQKWLEAAHDRFTADTVVFNIIPVKLDDKPPVLEFSEEMMDKSVAHQLFDLYDKDVFEQMVDEDGNFTYQLKGKYQKSMEKIMSKKFRRGI
tara:strand:+ start:302 stop:670 length:369 start_codon:yes stop_codon:yes gene_type:complete